MNERPRPIAPLTLLSDEPILEIDQDGLGLESWARVIAGIAVGTEGPFTVGILGAWGVGKTSILQLAKTMIDRSEQTAHGKITTVSFNAWEYEQESSPLVPLIAAIVYGLHTNADSAKTSKQAIQKLHDALASLLFGASSKVSGKIPFMGEASITLDSSKAIERYEELRAQWIERQVDKSVYYKASQTLKSIQQGAKRHRIVVFIDDLDRCFPDRAIQLLESIKLVLNHPGFIFVLAVDRRILESYLDKRYVDEFGMKSYHQGQSYLDKIIQLPLWIPPHEKRFDLLIETVLARPAMERHKQAFEALVEVLGWACAHNPRRLIRLFNDILVAQNIYELSRLQGQFPVNSFVVAHGVRHQSDLIYQELLRNRPLCNKLRVAKDAASLQTLILRLLKENQPRDIIRIVLRRLQALDSLVRLLISVPGREWLGNARLRGRIDNFLSAGWTDSLSEQDEISWIQTQVQRALADLESTDEDIVLGACDVLSALGDHTCMPALRLALTKWKGESRVGKVLIKIYQEIRFSYGMAQT